MTVLLVLFTLILFLLIDHLVQKNQYTTFSGASTG